MAFTGAQNSAGNGAAVGYPIARCFALIVLGALAALILLRQVFGSVRIEVGTR
jgi:hypothetical protein